MLQDRADKICEMANVMQKSIQIDEENMAKEQELMARLATENKVSPIKNRWLSSYTLRRPLKFDKISNLILKSLKGQIISKCLFGVFNFFH